MARLHFISHAGSWKRFSHQESVLRTPCPIPQSKWFWASSDEEVLVTPSFAERKGSGVIPQPENTQHKAIKGIFWEWHWIAGCGEHPGIAKIRYSHKHHDRQYWCTSAKWQQDRVQFFFVSEIWSLSWGTCRLLFPESWVFEALHRGFSFYSKILNSCNLLNP